MYKIGYVDEDKGWRNTFRQFFKDEFEISLFEINEETNLDELINDIFNQHLDVLVLDFRLDETGVVDFNADVLVEKIQERNLYFPLMILTSHELDALDHISNAHIVNGKDLLDGESPKVEIFKQKILKIASEYKDTVSDTLNRLKALDEKRQHAGLTPNEEDTFVELNNYIDKVTSAKSHLSRTFYSEDTNKKLDKLIAKSQEILNQLSEKK